MNEPPPFIAYHGDESIKQKYIDRVKAHAAADEIISGVYWQHGRGCAVGCTVHSDDHRDYERKLGIPSIIARLEDRLFESLFVIERMNDDNPISAKAWPRRFLESIPVGADLSLVWPKFEIWILVDEKDGVIQFAKSDKTRAVIRQSSKLYERWVNGDKPLPSEWRQAHDDAQAAYMDATNPDDSNVAYVAAYGDGIYEACYARKGTDQQADYIRLMADKLIELLSSAPVFGQT